MQNEWILDVLADLKSFAQKNGLPILAEHLDDTRYLALSELQSRPGRKSRVVGADDAEFGEFARSVGAGDNA